ncbi:hypothetical protein SVIOM342S_05691 [Streptomyces violaceorubidus]
MPVHLARAGRALPFLPSARGVRSAPCHPPDRTERGKARRPRAEQLTGGVRLPQRPGAEYPFRVRDHGQHLADVVEVGRQGSPTVARALPSGLNATSVVRTSCVKWARASSLRLSTSHSSDPMMSPRAIRLPSGLRAMA